MGAVDVEEGGLLRKVIYIVENRIGSCEVGVLIEHMSST